MKKIKFVTAIYSFLYGTEFGGRVGRKDHYRWGLLSLLKMTDAEFICYTSLEEFEELKNFFYVFNSVSAEKLEIKVFDLVKNPTNELITKWKDIENTKKSDRCIEIQYMKFFWCLEEIKNYEYVYWIDAGLSHCGLIPNKYLPMKTSNNNRHYYESDLFNNLFLKNLIEYTKEKFLLIAKENSRNYWSGTVSPKHFISYDSSKHIIGGLFGAKSGLWKKIVFLFTKYVYKVTKEDKRLYHEEDIMTLMFRNHFETFITLDFDSWNHYDAPLIGMSVDYFNHNKSFYKILEELNNIQ